MFECEGGADGSLCASILHLTISDDIAMQEAKEAAKEAKREEKVSRFTTQSITL